MDNGNIIPDHNCEDFLGAGWEDENESVRQCRKCGRFVIYRREKVKRKGFWGIFKSRWIWKKIC